MKFIFTFVLALASFGVFVSSLPINMPEELQIRTGVFADDQPAAFDVALHVIEPRGGGGVAGVIVKGLKNVVKLIVNKVKALINRDKDRRNKFTPQVVGSIREKYPRMNVIMCHPKHTAKFDGEKGKQWFQDHVEFDIKVGGTIGYDIYWGGSGEFTNHGDGGFLNWAFIGNVKTRDQGGRHVVFGPIS